LERKEEDSSDSLVNIFLNGNRSLVWTLLDRGGGKGLGLSGQLVVRIGPLPSVAPDRRHPGASFETVLDPSDPADPADISLQKTVSKYGKFDVQCCCCFEFDYLKYSF